MYFHRKGDQSRQADLERLSSIRNEGAKKATERVYRQSFDEDLIAARKRLIEAHKRREVERTIEIENEIKDYSIKRGFETR